MARLSTGKEMKARSDDGSSLKTRPGKAQTRRGSSFGVVQNHLPSGNGCMTKRGWRPLSPEASCIYAIPKRGQPGAGCDTWTKTREFFCKIFGLRWVA